MAKAFTTKLLWKDEDYPFGPCFVVVGNDWSPMFNGEWISRVKAMEYAGQHNMQFEEC